MRAKAATCGRRSTRAAPGSGASDLAARPVTLDGQQNPPKPTSPSSARL